MSPTSTWPHSAFQICRHQAEVAKLDVSTGICQAQRGRPAASNPKERGYGE